MFYIQSYSMNSPKVPNIDSVLWVTVHTHKWRVRHPEPYSGIQGGHERLWTLVDPDMYMCCMDIYPLLFLILSFIISSQKRLYHPLHHRQSHDRLSPSLQHHILLHPSYILLFTQHSPVICKDNFPLVYMSKSSRYYAVFHIDLGPMFPQSTTI